MTTTSLISNQLENNLHNDFTNVELLSPQECLEVRSLVHQLKKSWLKRAPSLPFYTLGTASYFHTVSENPTGKYDAVIDRYNPLLWEHFSWLYERLADALTQKLAAPVHYPKERLALPGFHIFLAHKVFEQPMAAIHRDLQYKQHKWEPEAAADFSNPISFTLAIALPKSGAGMNIWNLHHDEVDKLPQAEIDRLLPTRKQYFHAYELGKFALHSGLFLHQIAPIKNLQPGDERITLQGHGLFFNGAWHLHW
jgi:hypothetical protein